jgi:ferredoxin
MIERIREIAGKILRDANIFIGYERGFDAIHATPLFVRKEEDLKRLIWDPTCVHNLASYLPYMKERCGVLVKGCDSRAIVQYLQEGLIKREDVVIVGVPCRGVVDVKAVMRKTGYRPILNASFRNGRLVLRTDEAEKELVMEEALQGKCRRCLYPTPLLYDHLVSESILSDKDPDSVYADILELEGRTCEDRLSFWKRELSRCIRCYACRNACPMCICRDSCIAETREPKWVTQRSNLQEKFMFHMIHALHLAGRCVECGECERACPMEIPLLTIRRKMNLEMKRLFDYEAGIRPDERPPMYTFKVEEESIRDPEI